MVYRILTSILVYPVHAEITFYRFPADEKSALNCNGTESSPSLYEQFLTIDISSTTEIKAGTCVLKSKKSGKDFAGIFEEHQILGILDRNFNLTLESKPRLTDNQWNLDSALGMDLRFQRAHKFFKGPQKAAGPLSPPEDVAYALPDTGVDLSHPNLKDITKSNLPPYDCTNDTDGSDECQKVDEDEMRDTDGHGTMLAGIISANSYNLGITGIARSKVMPIRMVKSGEDKVSSYRILSVLHLIFEASLSGAPRSPDKDGLNVKNSTPSLLQVILLAWTINVGRPSYVVQPSDLKQYQIMELGQKCAIGTEIKTESHCVKAAKALNKDFFGKVKTNEMTRLCVLGKNDGKVYFNAEDEVNATLVEPRICVAAPNEFSWAMTEMKKRGIIMVTSAGDTGISLEQNDDRNSSWPSYLAADPKTNVITVGSSTPNGAAAENSNRGPTVVSLHAPGENILSTAVSPTSLANQTHREQETSEGLLTQCEKTSRLRSALPKKKKTIQSSKRIIRRCTKKRKQSTKRRLLDKKKGLDS